MPVVINITLEDRATPKLKKLTPRIRSRIGQKLIDIATFVQARALYYAYESPVARYSKTQKLASSIRVNVNTAKGEATVRADRRIAPYANIVETGAKPHEIPNNPIWRGKMHPGFQGKRFMTRAGVDASLIAPREISEGVRLGIKDSGFKR